MNPHMLMRMPTVKDPRCQDQQPRKQVTPGVGEDVEKLKPCVWLVRMEAGMAAVENSMDIPHKLKTVTAG